MGKRKEQAKERAKEMLSDKQFEETQHVSKRYAATVLSVVSVLICVLALVGAWLLKDYLAEENIERFRLFVEEHWFSGSLIFMAICFVQVVIAFIPGEAVEIAAGVIFGPFWGTLLCLLGITLGSIVVILLVRLFGRKFVESLYSRDKIDSLPILNNPKKRNTMVFLLFFIPGTPKDLMTYIVGLTEMSIPMYIILTTIARIPSILMSTLGGDAVGEGKIIKAIIIFAATALISGAGYLVYTLIQKKMQKKEKQTNIEK